MPGQYRQLTILQVEDNPADVRLTRESLSEAGVANDLHAVSNGKDALEFLHRTGQYAEAPRPDLIFLDLNLPGISGHEVLAKVKTDPDLLEIPVVVLTSSESDEDIAKCYQEHANCFISKPVDFAGFLDVIAKIESFWFSVVRLPRAA